MTFLKNLAAWTYLIIPSLLFSCENRTSNEMLIGNWKIVVDSVSQIDRLPSSAMGRGGSYEFINDSVVDTKRTYYKTKRLADGSSEFKFLGSITRYTIVDDSLKIFDLADSVWGKGRLLKTLTNDTLVLVDAGGQKLTFFRHVYKDNDNSSNVDAIALSSSGCFGTCPIMDIIIEANGNVTFFGEWFIDKKGFFEGKIPKERFNRIKAEFDRAEIVNLKKNYSVHHTDDETISTTFVSNNVFINSIKDYGAAGPDELLWGYNLLRYLYQDLDLKKLDTTKVPFYPDLHHFRFERSEEICDLTKSESFLLWNYLRKGKVVEEKSTPKYNIRFSLYKWLPSDDGIVFPNNTVAEDRLKSISTDGQYYTFERKGQKSVTVDIGFNFFDLNQKFLSFRKKGEYD